MEGSLRQQGFHEADQRRNSRRVGPSAGLHLLSRYGEPRSLRTFQMGKELDGNLGQQKYLALRDIRLR